MLVATILRPSTTVELLIFPVETSLALRINFSPFVDTEDASVAFVGACVSFVVASVALVGACVSFVAASVALVGACVSFVATSVALVVS